ncbi:APC membrane recruitment protein 1 [Scleropages formosus]|uniref:APC membrane recruitment protein 1 n=1 Tax=Scleropages formosus TaxID=113540 RepID=A0A8C9RFT6_SCLFO|nr:APC membrane recruitment protein 1 [Scleropages formosus]
MEPSRGRELRRETKPLSDGCGETAGGSEDLQPEAEMPSECTDGAHPEPLPPGKLRKTAFKLFGGRRSICVLPSFFGGRAKSHSKGSSKKGIIKSKTHDCISKVSWEDARKARDVPAGDFEYHGRNGMAGKTLPNSKSADVMNDCEGIEFTKGESSHLLTLETGDHKPSLDKSLSFPHPKRGLKGLFSSIRRHKKNKNIKIEKSDVDLPKEAETVFQHVDHHDEDLFGSLAESSVPPSANVKDDLIITHECGQERLSSEDCQVGQENLELKDRGGDEMERTEVLNTNVEPLNKSSCTRLPDVNPECAENDQPSDQISLIFGEVSSLKSFDSLTGCGDIIADQDDDSIADSSVSGERSRNAGKRSSCYVTYQGGGEEMATPDDIDGDYLQGLWESDTAADICYVSNQKPEFIESDKILEKTSDASDIPSPIVDAETHTTFSHDTTESLTPGEVLSPQSDHQESVPNSDEGYYDSTTPGPDDDGIDGVGQMGSDRLPRDSYSGDALYELFEPDDSLMSPPLKDMSSFETQKCIADPLEFLGVKLRGSDADLQSTFTHKTCVIETEEARLAKIQHELLYSELQSIQKPTKEYGIIGKNKLYSENRNSEFMLSKKHASVKEERTVLNLSSLKGKNLLQGSSSLKENNKNEIICSQIAHNKPPLVLGKEICNGRISQNSYKLQESASYADEGSQRPLQAENQGHSYSMNIIKMDAEHDQTICFSQALVDFTKRTELLGNLSASLGGAESNSPFAQNIQVLPSMVTFDIVDMENEGEYDNQVQMVADEDISSPFEDYSESFLQKDAFAECDDRLFDFNDQSLFFNNPWGVASLPRHLSLTRVNQPMPAPLSLNRRSRSLDTDCLEFEMSDLYLMQSRVSPFATLRFDADSNGSSFLHRKRSRNFASSELKDNACGTTASWQPEPNGTSVLPSTDGKRASQVQSLASAQKERAKLACTPNGRSEAPSLGQSPIWKSRPQVSGHAVSEKRPSNPVPQGAEQLTLPFCLPGGECTSQSPSSMTELAAETLCERAECIPDGRSEACFLKSTSAIYSDCTQQSKTKPIGVTQGVPHFCSDGSDTSKLAIHKEGRDFGSKGRQAVDVLVPVGSNKQT